MRAALILCCLALAACDVPVDPSPRPELRPKPAVTKVTEPSPASGRLAQYYGRVQQGLLANGLLRTDGGGPDAPYSARDLAENFIQTAAFEELTLKNGQYRQTNSAASIKRWTAPVRLSVEFSGTVPAETRARDTAILRRYAARLSRLTQHPVRIAPKGNFHIAVLDTDDLFSFDKRLTTLIPRLDAGVARQITLMSRDTYCVVYTFADGPAINQAIAIIRAEHPNLMRDACYHEEIAQGLGLSNDSKARPSIFNDDNEFALLTGHDEDLLRMLYDERMPLGAGPTEARPIANALATALLEPTS